FEEIFVKVKVPVETGTPKCEVTNNAPIAKAPGGTLINSFAGDDMSSARQERPLRQVAQHGRGLQEERLDLER
ncbi:MAG TPA: hypothetical protein VFR71_02875, partial [Methyloceanibacter sp.]|nr:hypothetical protein [Methyloceanibacter sp.]